MSVKAFEGVIEDGLIRVPDNLRFPEKTKVYIIVPESEARNMYHIRSPRLVVAEQAADFRKEIVEEDVAAGV